MANFKKIDVDGTDDDGTEEPKGAEKPGGGMADYMDEELPAGTGKIGKIIGIAATILVVVILAVGIFMGIRYSKRFDALIQCTYDYMEGDFLKPEFAPCVRAEMNGTSFDDVKLKALEYLIMAGDKESIPDMVTLLGQGGEVMRQAAQAIAVIGGESANAARDPILKAIGTGGPRDKAILGWALASLGDERAFRPLLDSYIDGYTRELKGWSDDFLVDYAARDPKALDEMIKLADSKDDGHRWFAATTMGKIRSDAVLPPLLKLVKDQNSNVVKAAAISLGMTGTQQAGEAILEVLARFPEMKDDLLRSIQQSAGAPGLSEVYKQTDSPSLKNRITSYIKDIKDPRSGDILIAILENIDKETEGKSPLAGLKTKKTVALALAEIGDPRAIPLLKNLMNLQDVKSVCKLYDCGPVGDFDNLSPDQVEAYLRGYRLSAAMSDYIDGLVNIGNADATEILVGMWKKIDSLNKKYRGDSYLYWPCRPAEVMYALGRLKVEGIGPMLENEVCSNRQANQRAISLNIGTKKDLTIPCPDIGAAAKALGRAKYTPILEKLIDIAKRPEDVDLSVPNVDNENIYSDRREVLQGMAFLGDSGAIEAIETILEDVEDFVATKDVAAGALPYVITPEKQQEVIMKIQDPEKDTWVRSWFSRSLIPRASESMASSLLSILTSNPPNPLITPLGVAIGESCNQEVIAQAMEFVETAKEPGMLDDAQSAALIAVILCGDDDTLAKALRFLAAGDNEERVRMTYTVIPFYLTEESFANGRVYKKLNAALFLKSKKVLWPWGHLTERMEAGNEDEPDGLSEYDMRTLFYEKARAGGWEREASIKSLLGMKAKGYVLALTREQGDVAGEAWEILREWQ
ncbi:MAG: HEAT repeat domain-containing protein [Pseudomonadota bacterium]